MYLMLGSRLDISFFNRFQVKLTEKPWYDMKRVLIFLKGTTDFNLAYVWGNWGESQSLVIL